MPPDPPRRHGRIAHTYSITIQNGLTNQNWLAPGLYKEVLTRELKNNSGVSTYLLCNEPVDKVIHLGFMEKHNIDVPKDFIKLPSFYWLPKLHKNPYGHRFIAASSACTTKPLSRTLTHCLKLILKHYKQYCAGIERRTGVNCFWVVNNSMEVIQQFTYHPPSLFPRQL